MRLTIHTTIRVIQLALTTTWLQHKQVQIHVDFPVMKHLYVKKKEESDAYAKFSLRLFNGEQLGDQHC